jgi:ribonuclease HII
LKRTNASEIINLIKQAGEGEFPTLEATFASDDRAGVQKALASARKRIEAAKAERARLQSMYDFEASCALDFLRESGKDCDMLSARSCIIGLDEVGRGPIAGPVAVGGVVLAPSPQIEGLNDSKQIKPAKREQIAADIKAQAIAYTVQFVDATFIDEHGIAAALRRAFLNAIADIESRGVKADVILLDGLALRLDAREKNVIKGDAQCASIAAASILAKVERDALMCEMDAKYPGYDFSKNAGYGTKAHTDAIAKIGLSPIHRESFCHAFTQPTLW